MKCLCVRVCMSICTCLVSLLAFLHERNSRVSPLCELERGSEQSLKGGGRRCLMDYETKCCYDEENKF